MNIPHLRDKLCKEPHVLLASVRELGCGSRASAQPKSLLYIYTTFAMPRVTECVSLRNCLVSRKDSVVCSAPCHSVLDQGQEGHCSVPVPTIQSETWLVHAKVREPHLNPPVRMNFLPLALVLKGKARKVHTNPRGSDAVRELSREPAMFQIGL